MSDTDIGFDVEGNSSSYFVLAISRLIYCLKKWDFEVLGITRLFDLFARVLIPGDGKQIRVQIC